MIGSFSGAIVILPKSRIGVFKNTSKSGWNFAMFSHAFFLPEFPGIVLVFVSLLVLFVAPSVFQVKCSAYVTMSPPWIFCMQTCLFFVDHHLHMYMFNNALLLPASRRSGAVHFCKEVLLNCIEK